MHDSLTSFYRTHNINISLFAISTVLHYILCYPIFIDGDVAWHISSGDYIREIGGIPYFDPWSYVGQSQQWYNISWLWDVLLSCMYELFGFRGLCIFCSTCFGVFYAMFHGMMCKSFGITTTPQNNTNGASGVRYDCVLMFLALSFPTFMVYFGLRPQLTSYFLVLLVYNLLSDYHIYYNNTLRENTAHGSIFSANIRYFFNDNSFLHLTLQTCCITVIWANLHGGFFLIGVILGTLGLEAIYLRQWMLLERWLIIGICALMCTLLNPIGYKIYVGAARTFFSAAYSSIAEWQQFRFGKFAFQSTIVAVLIIAGFAYSRRYTKLRVSIYDWLLCMLFIFVSLCSIRGFSMLVVLGARAFIALLDATMPLARYQMRLRTVPTWLVVLFLCTVPPVFIIAKPNVGEEMAPISEIDYAVQHYPGMKFINPYIHGGSIIFFGKGKIKHLIDGRAGTVFTEEVLRSYLSYLSGDGQNWADTFKNYDFDGIMLPKNALLNSHTKEFFSGWKLVFEGPIMDIYMKRAVVRFDASSVGNVQVIK